MGVCPQHDLLWPALTAQEHLRFYGRLKGLTGKQLKDTIMSMLSKVNLTGFAKRRAGGFSVFNSPVFESQRDPGLHAQLAKGRDCQQCGPGRPLLAYLSGGELLQRTFSLGLHCQTSHPCCPASIHVV